MTKLFHGKFTMISPAWLTMSPSITSTFQLSTDEIQKKWLKDIRSLNSANHSVKSMSN